MQKGGILVFLLVGIVAAAGAYYFGYDHGFEKSAKNLQPVASPTTLPSDETANWKTYTNSEYGFSIQYPQEWREDNSLDYFLTIFTFDPPCTTCGGKDRGVYISIEENKNKLNSKDYLKQVVIPLQQGCGDIKIVTDFPNLFKDIDGVIADGFCGAGSPGLHAYLPKGDKVIELSADGIDNETANSIFSTFKFTQ